MGKEGALGEDEVLIDDFEAGAGWTGSLKLGAKDAAWYIYGNALGSVPPVQKIVTDGSNQVLAVSTFGQSDGAGFGLAFNGQLRGLNLRLVAIGLGIVDPILGFCSGLFAI